MNWCLDKCCAWREIQEYRNSESAMKWVGTKNGDIRERYVLYFFIIFIPFFFFLYSCVLHAKFQSGIPIYNIAAGTCLGVERGIKHNQIVMDLCTKTDKSSISWDLVRSKLPLKEVR